MMAIDREEIRGNYSKDFIESICSKVRESGDFLGFMRQYMNDPEIQITRNALSAVCKASGKELATLKPLWNEMVDWALTSDCPAIKGRLLSIIEQIEMNEDDLRTDLLDFCLERMQHPDEMPSTQANCMKIAFRICKFYPELMEELKRTLEAMEISYFSPAVKNVRRRILNGKLK
ncbi:MAG: hypothetical protein Q4B58_05720 [Bacteroidales bacterium]|nr:hypothetical protein [Bacteroidales bacterium]